VKGDEWAKDGGINFCGGKDGGCEIDYVTDQQYLTYGNENMENKNKGSELEERKPGARNLKCLSPA
jgi:hypothetical protein